MFYFFKEKDHAPGFKKLVVILLLCVGSSNYAQVFYSVNPKYLKSKTEQNNVLSEYKYNYPDTSITEQINYFPRNFRGNTGLASPDYIWRYGTDDIGFRFVQSPLTNDKIKDKDINYFRSLGPYASLTGIAGSKEFQIFKMLFTHTYKDKVNITVRFNRYTSKGFYSQQQTYTNNFYLSSNYTTRKKNAGYYLYILNNGNKNQENGGIKDGVLTDSSQIYDKSLFKTNITNADRDNRELKFMINPWIRLNKNDSATKLNHYLQLKSRFSNNSYSYKDMNDSIDKFYDGYYLDSVKTVDSSHVRSFVNEISYSFLTADDKTGFSAGYKNEINKVWQHTDSFFVNHILQADLFHRTHILSKDTADKREKFFETHLNGQYALAGPNGGNFKGEGNVIYTFNEKKKRSVYLNVLYEKRSADYIYNNWVSNHFLWFNNGFNPQKQAQLKVGVNLNRFFSASLFYQTINNYLYFDEAALPGQYSGSINNLGLNINFTKIFFKHLGLALNHAYQNTSKPAYVRVPQNVTTAKLFYNGSLSHNNLQLQIGAQVQIYERFYGYAYMPATQMFYLQDKFKTDSYPYLDVYLSARIRPVSFFLKLENVLAGFAGPNYSFVPGYYQTDLAFRFGLTWMFFD